MSYTHSGTCVGKYFFFPAEKLTIPVRHLRRKKKQKKIKKIINPPLPSHFVDREKKIPDYIRTFRKHINKRRFHAYVFFLFVI